MADCVANQLRRPADARSSIDVWCQGSETFTHIAKKTREANTQLIPRTNEPSQLGLSAKHRNSTLQNPTVR